MPIPIWVIVGGFATAAGAIAASVLLGSDIKTANASYLYLLRTGLGVLDDGPGPWIIKRGEHEVSVTVNRSESVELLISTKRVAAPWEPSFELHHSTSAPGDWTGTIWASGRRLLVPGSPDALLGCLAEATRDAVLEAATHAGATLTKLELSPSRLKATLSCDPRDVERAVEGTRAVLDMLCAFETQRIAAPELWARAFAARNPGDSIGAEILGILTRDYPDDPLTEVNVEQAIRDGYLAELSALAQSLGPEFLWRVPTPTLVAALSAEPMSSSVKSLVGAGLSVEILLDDQLSSSARHQLAIHFVEARPDSARLRELLSEWLPTLEGGPFSRRLREIVASISDPIRFAEDLDLGDPSSPEAGRHWAARTAVLLELTLGNELSPSSVARIGEALCSPSVECAQLVVDSIDRLGASAIPMLNTALPTATPRTRPLLQRTYERVVEAYPPSVEVGSVSVVSESEAGSLSLDARDSDYSGTSDS